MTMSSDEAFDRAAAAIGVGHRRVEAEGWIRLGVALRDGERLRRFPLPDPVHPIPGVEMKIEWGDSDLPVLGASVFAVNADPLTGVCWLTVGQVVPLIRAGADEEQVAVLEAMGSVTAVPVGRFLCPLTEVRNLRDLLDRVLARVDVEMP